MAVYDFVRDTKERIENYFLENSLLKIYHDDVENRAAQKLISSSQQLFLILS
jgi:hypothetical protein